MAKTSRRALPAPPPYALEDASETLQPSEPGMSPAETAQYIAEFSAELSYLARQSKLDLLAYLLDMTRLEATRSVQADKRRR